ncbi:MAG TPA: DUF11 domain-containing protein [Anaerolineae bacterium]|nr:DUF11 domain-containing protein [Anaerolineae bacterium]HQK14283.1 DUF11 domain-containing protein [Anaerolineae bacterium]
MSENQKNGQAMPKQIAMFSFAMVGVLLIICLTLPQTSAAGSIVFKPLTFQSPIGNPILALDKTADQAAPQPGDIVNYTLSYSNTTPGAQAFNVQLYDFLPAGVQYLSASPAPAVYSDGILVFTAPSVGPDTAPINVNIQVRLLPGYAALRNQAIVTADGITPTTDSLLITTVPATNHLQLIKDGDVAVLLNDELEYTLYCINSGPVAYHNIEIFDILPTGVTLVSASVPPMLTTPPLLKWVVDNLTPGDSWEATVLVKGPSTIGTITNTALLIAPSHTSAQSLWPTHVISEGTILKVEKTSNVETVYPGDPLIYTLTYENKAATLVNGVVLTDVLPTGVAVSSAHPAPTRINGQQWVWEMATLDRGAAGSIVLTTTVTQNTPGILHNYVVISAPNAFGDADHLYTQVKQRHIYLPLVLRGYQP